MIANQTSMRDAMRMKLQYVCSRVGHLTLLNWKFWVCVTLVCLYHFLHWSRMPYRDRVSPDGRYIVEVYGNFFAGFIACAPGQGGDRSGKVVLKDRRTGKVIGSGYVPALVDVYGPIWREDGVYIMCGGECDDVDLKYPHE